MIKRIPYSLCFCLMISFFLRGTCQQDMNPLMDTLNHYMDIHRFPGAMISIVRADSHLFVGGLGYAQVENKERVHSQHLFRQGSISKSFTALALVHLMGEKGLALSTPIKDIDPDIPFTNEWEASDPNTVANLLEHSAGFDDFHAHAVYNFTDEEVPPVKSMVEAHQNSLYARWKTQYPTCLFQFRICSGRTPHRSPVGQTLCRLYPGTYLTSIGNESFRFLLQRA